eukprot:GFUD01039309.1.p1 GENE.GFUD01039309.1~~GFUD01039309.1.p1  ORF type:complete len:205 (+),score=38.83 GFUD01039309.1:57-671(+)
MNSCSSLSVWSLPHYHTSLCLSTAMMLLLLYILPLIQLSASLSCMPCCEHQDQLSTRTQTPLSPGMVDTEYAPTPPPCTPCPPPPQYCASGQVTKDVCACCDVCAKAVGQQCGGPWGISGTCADDLFCELDDFFPPDDFNASGICKQKSPKGCCARRVSKNTGQVYVLDPTSGGNCLYNCAYRKNSEGSIFCFMKGDSHMECQN